jgi:penicillin-binding protein 1C
VKARVIRFARFCGWFGVVVALGLAIPWWSLPQPPLLSPPSYSQRVLARDGALLRVTLTPDEKYRVHTPLADISPDLVAATLTHEDRQFFRHPGVNPLSAIRAGVDLAARRGGGGGASTITMQLARVRYGLRTRTFQGKLLQIYRALQIERYHSKREILELYLNVAPYGRNIEGVGAASLIYFGKPADKLTRHEAFALSVIPQSPRRRAPSHESGNGALAAAQRRISREMQQVEPLPFDPRATKRREFFAPHFVQRLLADHPAQRDIAATLDIELQRLLERQIADHLLRQRQFGVSNAAALLVDTRSMEVLAQCGSADFFDETLAGQVDGTRSRRSPGSTLKPFIYALAIDQGIIHPGTVLKDSPRSFAGYNPENFDGEFSGPITATEALARSRNVPAVALAAQLTTPGLYDWLISAGVRLQRESSYYGLALPLGGGEVTMEELVGLYTMLANGGSLRPLQRTLPVKDAAGRRVLSPRRLSLPSRCSGRCRGLALRRQPGRMVSIGRRELRTAFAMRGRLPSSITTCSRSGSAISTAVAIRRSSAAPALDRCSFKSSMRCALAAWRARGCYPRRLART